MSGHDVPVRWAILELLANGPSSFAAIHGFVARDNHTSTTVAETWHNLDLLEREELVESFQLSESQRPEPVTRAFRDVAHARYSAWLDGLARDQLSVDEVSLDEVGLWYGLTAKGRALFAKPPDWTLDWDEHSGLLRITAGTIDSADEILQQWLVDNKDYLVAHSSAEMLGSVELTDGKAISPAARLTARLERRVPPRH